MLIRVIEHPISCYREHTTKSATVGPSDNALNWIPEVEVSNDFGGFCKSEIIDIRDIESAVPHTTCSSYFPAVTQSTVGDTIEGGNM